MTIEEAIFAKFEMQCIRKRLLNLIELGNINSKKTFPSHGFVSDSLNDIYNLYRDFLKIYVNLTVRKPIFKNNDPMHITHNCYFYALDFVTPKIFINTLKSVTSTDSNLNWFFQTPIGIMRSQTDYFFTCDDVLKKLQFDLEDLNIDIYDSQIPGLPQHGGNKIAFYFSNKTNKHYQDYHFIRQNEDGTWSHKCGYQDSPKLCQPTQIIKNAEYKYRYIKTLELVKPSQKK